MVFRRLATKTGVFGCGERSQPMTHWESLHSVSCGSSRRWRWVRTNRRQRMPRTVAINSRRGMVTGLVGASRVLQKTRDVVEPVDHVVRRYTEAAYAMLLAPVASYRRREMWLSQSTMLSEGILKRRMLFRMHRRSREEHTCTGRRLRVVRCTVVG